MKRLKFITIFISIALILASSPLALVMNNTLNNSLNETNNENLLNNISMDELVYQNKTINLNVSNVSIHNTNNTMNLTSRDLDNNIELNNTTIAEHNGILNNSEKKNRDTHYLNISYSSCKLIIKTNGQPNAKYKNLSVNINFKKIDNNTYLVYPLLLNNTINVYSKFDNETLNKTVFLNYGGCNRTIQKNILVRDVYSIKENISVKLNFVPKTAYII